MFQNNTSIDSEIILYNNIGNNIVQIYRIKGIFELTTF